MPTAELRDSQLKPPVEGNLGGLGLLDPTAVAWSTGIGNLYPDTAACLSWVVGTGSEHPVNVPLLANPFRYSFPSILGNPSPWDVFQRGGALEGTQEAGCLWDNILRFPQ